MSYSIFDMEHDGTFVWQAKYVIDTYVLLFLIIRYFKRAQECYEWISVM